MHDKSSRNNLLLVPETLTPILATIQFLYSCSIHVCTCNHYIFASETQKSPCPGFEKCAGWVTQEQTGLLWHVNILSRFRITVCCSIYAGATRISCLIFKTFHCTSKSLLQFHRLLQSLRLCQSFIYKSHSILIVSILSKPTVGGKGV